MAIGAEQYFGTDELKIYRGADFIVQDHIVIRQPTLNEICDFGEQDYFKMVYTLTATPQSIKAQLWEIGKDYTEITPYQLFCEMLYKLYPKEKTSIFFGDLDFQRFQLKQREDNGDLYLSQDVCAGDMYDLDGYLVLHFNDINEVAKMLNISLIDLINHLAKTDTYGNYKFSKIHLETITIDEWTYNVIIDYLCKSHLIERDLRVPLNRSAKMALIEDAQEEILLNQNKEYHSSLKNMISAMVNSEGFKYNHSQVWDMKINAFMDSVKRIKKIKNANLLLQSGYSGFGVNLKTIDDKQIDWLGELI